MPYCSNCGSEVDETANYCGDCGKDLKVEGEGSEGGSRLPSSVQKIKHRDSGDIAECGSCHESIPRDADVCPECGTEYDPNYVQCGKCGKQISARFEVCPNCGTKFKKIEAHKSWHDF